MEILSTGDKIKRARVYKGITLKELCGDRISISKMSCIENGKVKADNDIIKYIADKMDIDYDYLVQDVYEQIESNIAKLDEAKELNEEIEEEINDNLMYSNEYEYYDLSFELMHRLFRLYLKNYKNEKIQLIISKYYDLYQKTNTDENTIIYFRDIALYLFQNREYNEAIAYYSRLREILKQNKKYEGSATYYNVIYNEGLCYSKLHKEEVADKLISEVIEAESKIKDEIDFGEIYQSYALICIRLKKNNAEEYIEKAYNYQKDDNLTLAISKSEYAEAYFLVNEDQKAINELEAGVEIFPKEDKKKSYVKYLNQCIRVLYDNEEYSKAFELTEEAINYAIETDEIKLIERTYYLKGSILQKLQRYREAEMYMNLSLDSLVKFGSKDALYERYLDMGNLYYKLGDNKDSIKYFNLAISIKRQI